MFWCEVTFTDTNTAFTLHKLNLSNRSTTFLWASERVLFCSVPFGSTEKYNGKVCRSKMLRTFVFIYCDI